MFREILAASPNQRPARAIRNKLFSTFYPRGAWKREGYFIQVVCAAQRKYMCVWLQSSGTGAHFNSNILHTRPLTIGCWGSLCTHIILAGLNFSSLVQNDGGAELLLFFIRRLINIPQHPSPSSSPPTAEKLAEK
jgi:hypothetical protein